MKFLKISIIIFFATCYWQSQAETPVKKLFKYHSSTKDIASNYNVARKISPGFEFPMQEGTVEIKFTPWGWGSNEGKWHFFICISDNPAKPSKRILLYKLPDDTLRLLWEEDKHNKKVVAISKKVKFRNKQECHTAFTWRQVGNKCEVKLFFNHQLIGKRTGNFKLHTAELKNFLLGDSPRWNPKSKFGTAIKDMVIWNKAFSLEEIKLNSGSNTEKGISFSRKDFVPGVKNKFSCLYTGLTNGSWILNYFDENDKKLKQQSFEFQSSANNRDKWNKTTFDFTPPEFAVTTEFNLKSPAKQARISKLKITPGIILRETPRHYWKGYWIWDGFKRPQPGSYRYFRGTFDLKTPDKVKTAWMQWLTDNGSEVWLNGNYIGKVGSWAVPAVSSNIAAFLQKGKNVLAVKGFCHSGGAAFLGELTINFEDCSKYISSNGKWKVHDKAVDGWKQRSFDDSKWKYATCKYIPSQNPYGIVPYIYSGKRRNVECVVLGKTIEINGSEKININIDLKSTTPVPPGELVTIALRKNKTIRTFKEAEIQKQKNGIYRISSSFCFPGDAEAGIYEITLKSQALRFTNTNVAGKIKYSPKPVTKNIVAEITRVKGTPRLLVNGKATPMITYKIGRARKDSFKYQNNFYQDGVRIFEISIPLYRVWTAEKTIDYNAADAIIEQLLFVVPKSKFIINFSIYAPGWWKRKNPSELTAFDNKSWPHADFASEKWRRESSEAVASLLKYIERKNCSNRIIGYFLSGGEDGQWMQWVEPSTRKMSGYSTPMKNYFRKWARKKYKKIQDLNNAWHTRFNNFSAVRPPAEKLRQAVPEGFIYDPAKYMQLIDFQQAFSEAVTDCIINYADIIKKVTNWKKIVGVYYGKTFSIGGYNEWAELGMRRLLKTRQLDFFCGVEYFQRAPGSPHSVSAPVDSITLNGKMFMDEADLRTFAGGAKTWAYTGNLWDTINTIKKIFAMTIVKNQALHWFDLHPGEFAAPGIMKAIKMTSKIAADSVNYPNKQGEIAVIVSERGFAYCSPEAKKYTKQCILHQWNGIFYKIGTPCDFYFLEDILKPEFPKYKMYVFINAWVWDDDLLAAADKLKQNSSVLVWFHAPGLVMNNKMSSANIQRLTGIKVNKIDTPVNKVKYEKNNNIPFLKNFEGTFSYVPVYKQLFSPSGQQCRSFGKLGGGLYPAGAFKDCGNWKSVFFSEPVITPGLLRNIAEYAGCHIYSKSDMTMLYVGSNILGIHSANTGKKTIYFPIPCKLKDLATKNIINSKAQKEIKFNMEFGETKLFQLIK